ASGNWWYFDSSGNVKEVVNK
ncbi:MAG: hypothetical protein K6E20_03430, partial [Acholeplasmatales bacterium]|nr:hypothetical protein [Acholeplasmatales bacterium]